MLCRVVSKHSVKTNSHLWLDYSSTLSLHPTPSPMLRHCKNDAGQQWPTTIVNTNYTLVGGCYNGTVNGECINSIDIIKDSLIEDCLYTLFSY